MNTEFKDKNLELRIQNIGSAGASILLGTYLLVTFSRWLHPALFSPTIPIITLVLGLGLLVVAITLNSKF